MSSDVTFLFLSNFQYGSTITREQTGSSALLVFSHNELYSLVQSDNSVPESLALGSVREECVFKFEPFDESLHDNVPVNSHGAVPEIRIERYMLY